MSTTKSNLSSARIGPGLTAATSATHGDCLFLLLCLCVMPIVAFSSNPVERIRREVLSGSNINVALYTSVILTIPLNDPVYSVSMSLFLLGNYGLPSNYSDVEPEENGRKRRTASRAAIYRAVESLLERVGGLPGRPCLLKSICEAAAWPVDHDGLAGQIIHTILTPSSTTENGPLHLDYFAAEQLGHAGHTCSHYFASCPATPLDMMTTLLAPYSNPDLT